ncbi:MAG: cytochrome c nitrite reductase small subunit [Desulfobaccales bacterium]
MALSQKKFLLSVLAAVVAMAVVGAYVAFGSPGLYAKSESPEFCGSCHVLQPEYESWFHSGAHQNIKCIDCHLPNNNLANHLFWKSVEGVQDTLAFHTGRISETIRISERGAAVVEANCRRCHAELLARINENRRCWDCHRRMSHKLTGTIETRNP